MPPFKDLTDMKFGRLTVLGLDEERNRIEKQRKEKGYIKQNKIYWRCICRCQNITSVSGSNLISNKTISCGCFNKEQITQHMKKYNQYDLLQTHGVGYTSNTNKIFYFDIEDYNKIKQYCWGELNGYIFNVSEKIYLHRLVMNFPDYNIDHINKNPQDCRKLNLRPCDKTENAFNTNLRADNISGYTGVYYTKNNKWQSYIMYHQTKINLGTFVKKEDAIKARLKAEKIYCGDFAPQKHLFSKYGV